MKTSLRTSLALGWVGLMLVAGQSVAQQATAVANPHAPVPLWADGAPGSEGKTAAEVVTVDGENEHRVSSINAPSITPYLVRGAKMPTAAVIIAPGGGHQFLSIDMEGYDVAKYLSGHGVAAFVLKYRLAKEKGSTYTIDGDELRDMQRAIRMVKAHAAEWNVDPARVGIMGFSAGGELAVKAAEQYQPTRDGEAVTNGAPGAVASADAIERRSDKPAFEALMYPGGLTSEIVGKVSKDMPPAFLLCGADDRDNIALGLAGLFLAMKQAGVSAELHEYAGVGHGFGLRLSQHGAVADWPQVFVEWMNTKGFLRGK
jgi:acetyl esterase/lipase